MKTAVVTVATGDFIEGARVFYHSLERHGLPDWIDRLIVGPEICDFATPVPMTTDYDWVSAPNLKNRESLKNFYSLTLDYDRVISVNADMLCVGDPSYLWSERIGSLSFYAVHDTAAQVYYADNLQRLGLDPLTVFNAGLYVYCRDAYPNLHEDLMVSIRAGESETYEVGDQGYWNHFFSLRKVEIGWLPTGLNYCLDQHFPPPMSADRRIIHFCGPKPWREKRIQDWTLPYYEMWEKERDAIHS